ncbi:MAG: hypothetical protein HC902_14550 [Calothrix sp. SM1_5_4]|nr:hypothetical protein [Calothrix sp. SM1_5_4]
MFHQLTVTELVTRGLIERGDSASSSLVLSIRGVYLGGVENMPPSASLRPYEIQQLREWIDGLSD